MRASALLAVVALATSSLALPFEITNATVSKMSKKDYENAKFTWFDVGLGACGGVNQPNEYVVALNTEQWNGGEYCWDTISVSAWGKSTQAAIVDMCPGCPYGGLDMSTGLFDFFTWAGAAGSPTDPGVIYGTWDFASGGGSGSSSGGSHQIHPNWNSGKCLDVQGGVMANGTPVQIYDCNGTGAQNWVLNSGTTSVQVAGTNYCLDAGDNFGNGSQLKIWQCYPGITAQTWYYTGDDRISLQNQGLCLDLTNGSTNDGTVMQLWSCATGNTNQVWTE